MRHSAQLSYPEVCRFLKEKKGLTNLEGTESAIPAYGIYNFLQSHYTYKQDKLPDTHLTFDKAEEYLEKYLSGKLRDNEAHDLADAIIYSERNFKKLQFILERHASVIYQISEAKEQKVSMSDREMFLHLLRLKNKKTVNTSHSHFYNKKLVAGILSVAAILFILFIIPFQSYNNLDELYNFDTRVPLDFNQSNLRGYSLNNKITDPEYKKFKFQFNKGMSEYLAREYANALKDWKSLEGKVNQLKDNPDYNVRDEKDFILYNALCRVALYLSKKDDKNNNREQLLNEAVNLFEKLPINSDIEKYYYALVLGLKGNKNKAIEILNSINIHSAYYDKKIVLQEQLNQ